MYNLSYGTSEHIAPLWKAVSPGLLKQRNCKIVAYVALASRPEDARIAIMYVPP
jgi:hypothetical protein